MSNKRYGDEIQSRAKALWLIGRYSDREIARRLNISRPQTIGTWRRNQGWEKDKLPMRDEVDKQITTVVADTVAAMNSRHLEDFKKIREIGYNALVGENGEPGLAPGTAIDAKAMIECGIKGERMVRGEAAEVAAMKATMEANMQAARAVVQAIINVIMAEVKDPLTLGKIQERVHEVLRGQVFEPDELN